MIREGSAVRVARGTARIARALQPLRWLPLSAVLALLNPTPAGAGARAGRAGAPPPMRFHRFTTKGYHLSVYKPVTLKLVSMPKRRRGFAEWRGTETLTGTVFRIFAVKQARTRSALLADAAALTGIPATSFLRVLARGPGRGFAWQEGHYGQPKPGRATSVLMMRHGKRSVSYILVVDVDMAMATRYLSAFKKAYEGLKALP